MKKCQEVPDLSSQNTTFIWRAYGGNAIYNQDTQTHWHFTVSHLSGAAVVPWPVAPSPSFLPSRNWSKTQLPVPVHPAYPIYLAVHLIEPFHHILNRRWIPLARLDSFCSGNRSLCAPPWPPWHFDSLQLYIHYEQFLFPILPQRFTVTSKVSFLKYRKQ